MSTGTSAGQCIPIEVLGTNRECPALVSIDGFSGFTPIAKGGFSQVYEARQHDIDRQVAVKVLSIDKGVVIDRNAFATECRALGSVSQHPNVVTVHQTGFTNEGYPFIVMELCVDDLASAIRRSPEQCLPVAEVLAIGRDIYGALADAHSAGVLHRDLKPQNILFTSYDQPVLADFGIASLPGEPRTHQSWALSRHYAAPEVFDEEKYTVACDIYSLGATLYTALAGHRPFVATDDNAPERLEARIRNSPVPPIRRQVVPDFVEHAVQRLMAKHPQDRPASAEDAQDLLDQLRRRVVGEPTQLTTAVSSPQPVGVAERLVRPPDVEPDQPVEEQTGSSTIAYKEKVRPPVEHARPDKSRRPLVGIVLLGLVLAIGGISLVAANWCDLTSGDACSERELQQVDEDPPVFASLPPTPPSNVSVTTTALGYEVRWSAVDDVSRYRVLQIVSGESTTVEATSTDIPHDDPTANWCVRVWAINDDGVSSPTGSQGCSS